MTLSTIQAAGFVIANNEAIWGYGPTADAAWASFQDEMKTGGVAILADGEDSSDMDGSWTRESDYRCSPASAAFLAEIETVGGNLSWDVANGVTCTPAESEAREFVA